MESFTTLTGVAAVLPVDNVDTDQIIPARFLKTVDRVGVGRGLFDALRFHPDGRERESFVLNLKPFRTATILIAGANFGCGSSREHAPWALLDFGIRCVIAPSFADIFRNNSDNVGLLTVALPIQYVEVLAGAAAAGEPLTVDLRAQTVTYSGNAGVPFEIAGPRKTKLLHGLDAIGLTLCHEIAIGAHERRLEALA